MKAIDSPLMRSYTVAVLTRDHSDRMFIALDPYQNDLVWSRQYRAAFVYDSEDKALKTLQEIGAGHYPVLTHDPAGVDLLTLRVLETRIGFSIVATEPRTAPIAV
ncbi:MAG: hypothetical protein ACREWG_11250 [Gammaproteobacteria bacterium]